MCSVLWSNFKQKKQQQLAQATPPPVTQTDTFKTILAAKIGKSQKQSNVRALHFERWTSG